MDSDSHVLPCQQPERCAVQTSADLTSAPLLSTRKRAPKDHFSFLLLAKL